MNIAPHPAIQFGAVVEVNLKKYKQGYGSDKAALEEAILEAFAEPEVAKQVKGLPFDRLTITATG
ncbi:MAG: hypothetical protein QE263_09145 [Vampirovibrionales bacterium]|nr:hypothetical protein [Vampirovibrionales bacterium]